MILPGLKKKLADSFGGPLKKVGCNKLVKRDEMQGVKWGQVLLFDFFLRLRMVYANLYAQ